jgi:hypothetical protein
MSGTQSRPAYVLSAIIALLMTAASAGGLFTDNPYRDNALVTAAWYGNDLVTLVVAVPLLLVALILSMRGSLKAQLVLLGMLDYALYNFAFYLFGAAFNRFFLVYVALFMLPIYALIFGLVNLDVKAISQTFRARTPVRWISAYMLLVALMLGGMWIFQSLSFIPTGQVPEIIVEVDHPTNVIAALDLSLVVSVLVLGAIWLWKRQPWGYVLAAMANVKSAVYSLVLAVSSATAALAGHEGAASLIPLWGFLSTAALIASVFLLANVRQPDRNSSAGLPQHDD